MLKIYRFLTGSFVVITVMILIFAVLSNKKRPKSCIKCTFSKKGKKVKYTVRRTWQCEAEALDLLSVMAI